MQLLTDLPYIIFWLAAVIFLIACTLLSYSLIRSQQQSAGDMESEQSFRSNGILETVWTLIPVGILILLLILTFQTISLTK